jgi:hypothetical protein
MQPFVVQPMATPTPTPPATPPPPAAPAPPPAPPRREAKADHRPPRTPAPAPVVEAAPSVASVQAKYQEVARDYGAFKKAYGPRLDAEWNDVLDFATYGNGDDKAQKLDARLNQFRKHMAQVKAGGI